MLYYLMFGLGFYTSACIVNRHTFSEAKLIHIINGFILGCLLWPIAAWVLWYDTRF